MSGTASFILIVGACLGSSFLFSGIEAGVQALSRLRIRQRMRAGDPRAAVLHGFLERPENFLWTILVGNTLANFAAVALLLQWLFTHFAQRRLLLAAGLAGVVIFIYTFCELLPKLVFRAYPNRLTALMARPFRLVHFILSPLVSLIEWLSTRLLRWTGGRSFQGQFFGNRDELRLMMQESGTTLTGEEHVMVNRVLDLQNLTVRQIARPLANTAAVDHDTPVGDVLALCREQRLGRVPVWREESGRRRIAGLVQLNSILFAPDGGAGRTAGDFLQPAVFVEEGLRLELALERLRRAGQRVAIVVGADGRERGVVGLRDILKIVFGEVPR